MATIFDYLLWRGDVTFSADPFNEVDNLVLSELSYTDFQGIVPPDGTPVPLKEAHRLFFAAHSREEIAAARSFTAKAPLLMDEMVKGRRFENMTLSHFIDESGESLQLSAMVCHLEDGTGYVAFRGTDGTVEGWKEDFNFSFMNATPGQLLAAQYLNLVPGTLRVGGHSKGGNLAVYASAFCSGQERIVEVYSNDGPGFREEVTRLPGFQSILPKVRSIVPDSSVIGLLLYGGYERIIVRSSAGGILQHDGFTWQVQRNRFERAARSGLSLLAERTVADWMSHQDRASLQSLTETVFTLIESTGKERLHSIGEDKLKSAESMIGALRNIPKDRQQELLRLLAQLGQSGGQALISRLTDLLKL